MFETYPDMLTWRLDKEYGDFDFLDPALHLIADVLMVILVAVGSGVTTLARWAFALTDMPNVQEPLTRAIGGSAGAVMVGIFPSALAIGALVAFFKSQRGDGEGYSHLAWVLVSAVAAATLLQTPKTWVEGVDQGRLLGTEVAMSATEAGIGSAGGGIEKIPFSLENPSTYQGDAKDRVVRRSSDAVWRVYVGTPWCLAEFGSLEICEKYGRRVLDFGTDSEKRKEFLQEELTKEAVGEESMKWKQGHRPMERAGVLLVAVPVALLFGILLIVLLLGSITALMGALFLLIVGPFFAALWVIPGRPRQWGIRWADALIGTVLQSAIVTLTAGAVMTLQMITAMAMPTYGWVGSSALSLAGAAAAFKYRSILSSIVGAGSAGGGGSAGALLGALATRSVSRHAGRLVRTPGRLAGRLGDAIERRHRPPTPAARPVVRRPAPPPPPPAGGPGGARPGRPSSGPGRGPGSGGVGPRVTVGAARNAGRAAGGRSGAPITGAGTGAGSPAPAPTSTPVVPGPGRRGRAGAGSTTTSASSTSSSSAPSGSTSSSSAPARTVRPTTGAPRTQPPAPPLGARRAALPPPRVARPRPASRRYPPPPPRT
ncbi:hypothetical protein [Streptomyces sp. NPDC048606]|uniref:hypothetical protein n=1 Tax=Streptomyces sp. NPDC048606 TaxID=3154726 RepID=UPI003426616B